MFDFYHNHLLRVLPTTKLFYMDTDSLIILLSGNNVEDKLLKLADDHLDNSGYDATHRLSSEKSRMKLGMFKNELPTDSILGFCCLKPKLYALHLESGKRYNRVKGVKRCEAQKFRYNMCVKALE